MPDGDGRGNAAALTIGAIVALIAAYVSWGWGLTSWQRVDADRRAYQRAAYTEEHIERTCVMVERPALIECIQEAIDAGREDQRANYDLSAQEDMARWAWWLLLTSIATVMTAGVGIYYVRETLVEAQASSGMAREVGEAQTRAYISVSNMRMKPDEKGVIKIGTSESFNLHFDLFNAGNSPARNVRISYTSKLRGISGGQNKVSLGDIPSNYRDGMTLTTFLPSTIVQEANAGDGGVGVATIIECVYEDVFMVEHTEIYEFGGVYFFVREEGETGGLSFRRVERSRRVHERNKA